MQRKKKQIEVLSMVHLGEYQHIAAVKISIIKKKNKKRKSKEKTY